VLAEIKRYEVMCVRTLSGTGRKSGHAAGVVFAARQKF